MGAHAMLLCRQYYARLVGTARVGLREQLWEEGRPELCMGTTWVRVETGSQL